MTTKPTLIAAAFAAIMAIALSASYSLQTQGQAAATDRGTERRLSPGDILTTDKVDLIERPGRYGLGSDIPGSRYAISDGHLLRIDPDSMKVQSILRSDVRPLE